MGSATGWPLGRIRSELDALETELSRWEDYRHVDLGESFRERANRVLEQLATQPDVAADRLPHRFEFLDEEISSSGRTVRESGARRLSEHVARLRALLPERLQLAERPAGGATVSGTPWPLGRLRIELHRLDTEVAAWRSYPALELGRGLVRDANLVLLHLRSQPGAYALAFPADFSLTRADVTPSGSMLTAEGVARLETFLRRLRDLVPGADAGSRTALGLAALHPAVQLAAGTPWREERYDDAVRQAALVVVERLRALSELPVPDDSIAEAALGGRAPGVVVADVGQSAGRRSQDAVRHLAQGLVELAAPDTGAAERGGPPMSSEAAYERLALASLVLHQLEFARPAARA